MADEPATPPEGPQTTAAATADPAAQAGAQEKTFTQAELDKIVTDRLNRQKAQFGDVDDLKAKAAKLEELENQSKSDTDKLIAATEKANKQAADADERARVATEKANETLKRAAVIAQATKAGAVDGEDVYRLLDPSKLTIDDNGDIPGLDLAVNGLLEAKPHLRGAPAPRTTPASFDGGGQGGTSPPGMSMDDLIRHQVGVAQQ